MGHTTRKENLKGYLLTRFARVQNAWNRRVAGRKTAQQQGLHYLFRTPGDKTPKGPYNTTRRPVRLDVEIVISGGKGGVTGVGVFVLVPPNATPFNQFVARYAAKDMTCQRWP
jgi:hypothetical protein